MPETLRCAGCGSGLPPDAPEGLCPECLLKEAIQGGWGPDEGPSTTTPDPLGSASVPLSPEDLAPHFPQLEILELLGQGGMGVVYKTRQVRLDRLVALKILPPDLGRDPAFAQRFAREARALARLAHPRIVGVHDFGESGGLFYILMEFVDGLNLRGLIREGRLKPEDALRIVPQICEALQYAHDEGIIHRDIKPENILLDRRGNVKIADFGLAKLLGTLTSDSMLTGSRQVMGTLRYMAPEQMETPLEVDHRADIYSLGVVFYEMLTGELPVGRFAPPSKKADVDVRLDEVVFRALEKEPALRYQHVSEVKTEVESLSVAGQRPATRSEINPNSAEIHPVGTAGIWRQAWPLIPISCAAYIVGALDDYYRAWVWHHRGVASPSWSPGTLVLVAGVGLWALWQFVRRGRTGDFIRRARTKNHQFGAAWTWRRAWPLLALIGAVYIVYVLTTAGLASILFAAGAGAWAWWQFGRGTRAGHIISLDTVKSFRLGTAGIWREAWLLIPVLCAAWIVYAFFTIRQQTREGAPASPLLLATIVFAVGLGLWAFWQFAHGGRARDMFRLAGANGRPPGAARGWQQAWVLSSIFCSACIVYAFSAMNEQSSGGSPALPVLAATIVLATGVGLWALWQFVRGAREADIVSLAGADGRPPGTTREWRQAWLLSSIFCAACSVYASFAINTHPSGEAPAALPATIVLADGVGLWALWQFVQRARTRNKFGPDRDKSGHLAAAAIWRQAWLLIPISSAAYIVGALYTFSTIMPPHTEPLLLATSVLATGVGLWALWQFARGGRAVDTKTILHEIEPPLSGPGPEIDGF